MYHMQYVIVPLDDWVSVIVTMGTQVLAFAMGSMLRWYKPSRIASS